MSEKKYWNEEIETLSRPELEKLQLERLKEMVKFSYENAPYYKRSFDEAGVKPEDIKSLDDIAKFPFINKQTERETQGVGSFLGELCAVPEEDVVFISTSTGSTGVPTMSPFTKQDFDEFQDTESRWFWQIGMRPNDRYVHALNFSLYAGVRTAPAPILRKGLQFSFAGRCIACSCSAPGRCPDRPPGRSSRSPASSSALPDR